jgi:hypothetical protein
MKLNAVLDFVNFIIAKEQSGNILSPSKFNTLLTVVNLEMYNSKVQEAEMYANQNSIPFTQALFGQKTLKEFHKKQSITFSSGIYTLSSLDFTFGYWGALNHIQFNRRKIELVSDNKLNDMRNNLLYDPIEFYPVATLINNSIYVYPSNITTAEFFYMTIPNSPVYDYYLDQYQNKVYLEAGADHLLTTGETGSAGQVSGQTVGSLTVELEWNELMHTDFCYELIKKLSPHLDKAQLYQYAQQEKVA